MYESKLGTEKEIYLTQIKVPPKPKKLEPRPKVEENAVLTRKNVEYLDNFQYKETKEFRKIEKGSKLVHQRLSTPIGGSYEKTSYQKIKTASGARCNYRTGSALRGGKKTTTTTTTTKTEQNTRTQSRGNGGTGVSSTNATKNMISTTKFERRGDDYEKRKINSI